MWDKVRVRYVKYSSLRFLAQESCEFIKNRDENISLHSKNNAYESSVYTRMSRSDFENITINTFYSTLYKQISVKTIQNL